MVELEFLECWFLWKVENRRTTLGASWEPTKQTQPTYGTKPELNPGYIGGRRALPPLHHPWFPAPQQKDVLCYHLVNSPSLVTSSMLFFLTGLLVRWRFSWLLRNQNKRYHYAQSEETEKSPDDAKCRKTCANDCEQVLPVLRCKTLLLIGNYGKLYLFCMASSFFNCYIFSLIIKLQGQQAFLGILWWISNRLLVNIDLDKELNNL